MGPHAEGTTPYSMVCGAKQALRDLRSLVGDQIPPEAVSYLDKVTFSTCSDGHRIYFPCPFKENEAAAALKAVEASVVAAISDLRYGPQTRKINIDLEKTAAFLFSTYIATIGGMGKGDPGVKSKLKDTDLFQAQSILYRRLSANLYQTKNGEYFHIHGSLEAGRTLNMIGLEAYRPDLTGYRECINTIEGHVKRFTTDELELMNARERQAGVTALKWDDFQKTSHGKALLSLPPWMVSSLEAASPPTPFTPTNLGCTLNKTLQPLSGIRVLELCRIIAGPSIGRTLAEYGASVLKITSSNLPDVPFFQVDGNVGKHCCDLDLKSTSGRKTFEELLQSADVILNGYRPGALEKLGYGPQDITKKLRHRGRGIVYITEDCFGPSGEWSGRPGWQQIADCVTGVAWAQGQFMGLNEPVVPPFPMSDYGTGCMGAIAALTGLLRRANEGGSWFGRTSLCQYDVFLQRLGLYGECECQEIRETFGSGKEGFFELRHSDSVDEIGGRALRIMKRCHPQLFEERMVQRSLSKGFGEYVTWVRNAVHIEGVNIGFMRSSRPNGFDPPSWDAWEVDRELLKELDVSYERHTTSEAFQRGLRSVCSVSAACSTDFEPLAHQISKIRVP